MNCHIITIKGFVLAFKVSRNFISYIGYIVRSVSEKIVHFWVQAPNLAQMFVGIYWTGLGVGAKKWTVRGHCHTLVDFSKNESKNTIIVRYMICFGSYCRGLMIVRDCHVIRNSVGSGWWSGCWVRVRGEEGGGWRAAVVTEQKNTFTDVPYRETTIRMKVICVYLRSLMRIWTSKHYILQIWNLAILHIYGKVDHELEFKQPAEQQVQIKVLYMTGLPYDTCSGKCYNLSCNRISEVLHIS
jgi:hypothetical protein